jgi:hypothetical protein
MIKKQRLANQRERKGALVSLEHAPLDFDVPSATIRRPARKSRVE